MIGFRVDANSEIGTGHLMRCLSIAKKLKEKAESIVFFMADSANKCIVKENGFRCIVLDGHYRNLEEELLYFPAKLKKEQVDVLIVDSYFVTEKYLECLRGSTKVVYIDDLHEMVYPCDLLVNYTIFADSIDYEKMYQHKDTKLLLGCSYAPLREEFEGELKKDIRNTLENILILSGGTDAYHFVMNFTEKIAKSISCRDIHFHIVCGRYNTDKEMLRKITEGCSNLSVYENLTELKKYMVEADIAISAGGTTLYELAACGTPTIGYSLADNQLENLDFFAKKGCLISAGDIRKGFPKELLLKKMNALSDRNKRVELSTKMRLLVDGNGCERLAKEIQNLLFSHSPS